MAATAGGGMKGQSTCQQKRRGERVGGGGRQRLATAVGARESRAATMTAQLVMAGNGGYRGWRHEEAVTMATKEGRRAHRWWQAAAATAGGSMKGQHPPPDAHHSYGK